MDRLIFLKRDKRMWFSALGVIIAAMLLILVTSLSEVAIQELTQQMTSFGSDKLILLPFKLSGMKASSGIKYFSEKDIKKVQVLGCVKDAYGVIALRNQPLSYKGQEFFALVLASEKYMEDFSTYLPLKQGRYVRKVGEMVVGYRLADELDIRLGDTVKIGNRSFRVVGILKQQEAQTGSVNSDTTVFISTKDGERLAGEHYYLIVVDSGCPLNITRAKIEGLFDDVTIISSEFFKEQLDKAMTVFTMGTLVLGMLAGIIASLGVINSMIASVIRRRRSIALMKVLGMNDKELFKMLLMESGAISLAGIVVGGLLGLLVFYGAILYLGWKPIFSWVGVLGLLGIVIVGSVLPAWFGLREVKRISPKEALSS